MLHEVDKNHEAQSAFPHQTSVGYVRACRTEILAPCATPFYYQLVCRGWWGPMRAKVKPRRFTSTHPARVVLSAVVKLSG